MKNNYKIEQCTCGRIHFINKDKFYDCLDKGGKYIFICTEGGGARAYGLDKSIENEPCVYCNDLDNGIYGISDISKEDVIDIQNGYAVYMMTGETATSYTRGGGFQDIYMSNYENENSAHYKNRSKINVNLTLRTLMNKMDEFTDEFQDQIINMLNEQKDDEDE